MIPATLLESLDHKTMKTLPVRWLARVGALAAIYVVAGRLGLMMDAVGGFATLVWPAAGIALAALLLFGSNLWPGVALGAFAVNFMAGAPAPVALGIALGNTLEAVLGAWALRSIPGFRNEMERLQDVLGFILLAAGLSTVVAATIGVGSLFLGGVVPAEGLSATWSAWWMGDAIGELTVAPLLLTWGSLPRVRDALQRPVEAAALAVILPLMGVLIFTGQRSGEASAFLQPYLLAPPLLWAALRFQQRGAVTALFVVSVIAVLGTAASLGPFREGSLVERLRSLQTFMMLLAPTLMVLGAVTAERVRAEHELRLARDAAEGASRAKSKFLAVMSHELRTPLTGIIGYADLMQAGVTGPLNQRQEDYVGRLKRAAWHLVGVIEGILTFSRLEAGRDEARMETVDAVALAREAIAVLEPEATSKGLAIRLAAPDAPLPLPTDRGKVLQILLNLLGNAVKFSDRGMVRLDVERRDSWVLFRVRDDGPGIPPERLDKLFDPFTQVSEPGTAKGGVGLGLSVSRTFAQLLGGDIEVESAPGHGSVFTLRLPDAGVLSLPREPDPPAPTLMEA